MILQPDNPESLCPILHFWRRHFSCQKGGGKTAFPSSLPVFVPFFNFSEEAFLFCQKGAGNAAVPSSFPEVPLLSNSLVTVLKRFNADSKLFWCRYVDGWTPYGQGFKNKHGMYVYMREKGRRRRKDSSYK